MPGRAVLQTAPSASHQAPWCWPNRGSGQRPRHGKRDKLAELGVNPRGAQSTRPRPGQFGLAWIHRRIVMVIGCRNEESAF